MVVNSEIKTGFYFAVGFTAAMVLISFALKMVNKSV